LTLVQQETIYSNKSIAYPQKECWGKVTTARSISPEALHFEQHNLVRSDRHQCFIPSPPKLK